MKPPLQRMLGNATRLTRRTTAAALRGLNDGAGLPAMRHLDTATADAGGQGVDTRLSAPLTSEDSSDGLVSRSCFESPNGAIDYRLFLPVLTDGAKPRGLVLMLHGCSQSADDFALGTRMDEVAGALGLAVLYPEQSQQANAQRCWNWFKHTHQRRGGGEAGLLEALVHSKVTTHGIEPDRVYVAGLSAGGAMAAVLGDVCRNLFAAVGVHSGMPAGAARNLSGALALMRNGQPSETSDRRAMPDCLPPTIIFHGDADRTVHPDNALRIVDACRAVSVSDTGVEPSIGQHDGQDGGRAWRRTVHRRADGHAIAERWQIEGAGHAWSGGDSRGSFADQEGPDASAEMLRFFLAQSQRLPVRNRL